MDAKIHMMATASEVFSFLRKNPTAIHEDVFQYISDYINQQRIREETTKIAMIGAAGKAFEMMHKNPTVPEKILLKDFMNEIPRILSKISE